jgi:hypothetical protein
MRPLLIGYTLFSDGAHRKAFRESVRPGWEYLGRKMVSFPCLSGPWPLDTPHPTSFPTLFLLLFSCHMARKALP